MPTITSLRHIAIASLLFLRMWAAVHAAAMSAIIDTDEHVATPVSHRYVHGVISGHAKFQLALPDNWNGELAIFSRGFSGTELTTGSFKTTALQKGYAFAASDEGWNRYTIANRPQDSYYESRQRIRELTLYAKQVLIVHYGRGASRTLMMGGSNGGHHTKWMVESYPGLYDGGIAGFGFNSQVSQWGSIATLLRNYDVIASRIDDIIQKRMADPRWDPIQAPLTPPLAAGQLRALQNIYDIPATLHSGFKFNVGRWKGSEAQWKSDYNDLLAYLRDSMPRFDETFHPKAGPLTDDELKLWDPLKSPKHVAAGTPQTRPLRRPEAPHHHHAWNRRCHRVSWRVRGLRCVGGAPSRSKQRRESPRGLLHPADGPRWNGV